MEWVFWVIVSLIPIMLGVLVLRRNVEFTDALYARDEPNYYDETQPTFYSGRSLLDPRDREVRIAIGRFVAVGAIIIGLGMLLALVVLEAT